MLTNVLSVRMQMCLIANGGSSVLGDFQHHLSSQVSPAGKCSVQIRT